MAAVHSCYRTMEAMAARDFPDQKFIDWSFRSAALQLSGLRLWQHRLSTLFREFFS